ncbi:unnamed protein product, partial [Rotaria sp. Silwood2]
MDVTLNDTIYILERITIHVYRISFPPLIILSIIGHILNLILFTRPNLISNSCCNYCLAASCVTIVEILVGQLFRLLHNGFNIDWPYLWLCRVRLWILYSAYLTSAGLITLASLDRFASSCYQVKYRRWANVKIARRLISIVPIVA